MSPPLVRRASGARAVAAALAAVLAAPAAAARADLRPVPFEQLQGRVRSGGPVALTARGLELDLAGFASIELPFAAEELEVEVEADGPVLLTWAARSGPELRPFGPPWRYARLPAARETLRLDLRIVDGWHPRAQPVLVLGGGGHVVLHALRARPPTGGEEGRAAYDRAVLWAPESVGHTTINLLTPSFWSASRGVALADVIAGAALAAFAAVLAGVRARRGRWRPGLAVAAAALVAVGAWNVHFLARFLPMANLAFAPDPEARIRENYYFAPDVGALAALARATLREDERVGTMGAPNDWFAAQTLCFNLQPRRCAIVKPGAAEHAGISGVGRLREDELDAIVAYRAGPLPDGFVPVAAVSPHAVVARRR
jgi:hypothetical protein